MPLFCYLLLSFFSTHQLNSKNNDPGLLFYTILGTETISYHFLPQMAKMDFDNLKLQKITNKLLLVLPGEICLISSSQLYRIFFLYG